MLQALIQKIAGMEDVVVPTLFKPGQFNIIKKLSLGKKLNENEKRYLRGKMKNKLMILTKFMTDMLEEEQDYKFFLAHLGSYYITGFEALKYNGFGWYFKTKIIEIINTKLEGKVIISGKTLKIIRAKSIRNSKFSIDKKTGLKYATNEQILKDIKITKNKYAEIVCRQMLSRYEKLFIKNYNKFQIFKQKPRIVDYVKYGV
ncbi:hypothetical protein HYX16_00890 [Candidatus Woesearchaeota archaeon]|nr:hypothetical protein [Candidatus Woesearchaeota archaeon]